MSRAVRLRARAADDLEAARVWYQRQAGASTTLAFIDAVERAFDRIRRNPSIGSLRFAYDVGVPDVRACPVAGFPFVVFYVVGGEVIDVWRVLHERRDLPELLSDAT